MSSLIIQMTSRGCLASLTLTKDVLLCLFSSLFLSFPDSQLHKNMNQPSFTFISISPSWLSYHPEIKHWSDYRLQATDITDVYSPEMKRFLSLCLLEPSDFPLYHFPPCSQMRTTPSCQIREQTRGSDSLCWLDEVSFSQRHCGSKLEPQAAQVVNDSILFIVLF